MIINITYICILLSLVAIILASVALYNKKEGFDAFYNSGPEWFKKGKYDINDWFVYYEPDQLSKPECTDYRGNSKELNWNSSAYRFFRM
jgi:hypothetical protein